MAFPLKPPILPQLARSRAQLPVGEEWAYEPKYDGFRAIVFVDGEATMIQSRGGKPLARYFPELRFPPGQYVLDGEIVIDDADGGQDFGALQQRIHPAESRINMLAESTPAHYVAFDALAVNGSSLLGEPFAERRAALERTTTDPVDVTPLTITPDEAEPWLRMSQDVRSDERRSLTIWLDAQVSNEVRTLSQTERLNSQV